MINNYDVILLVAGKGTRCNLSINKVFYEINNKAIFTYSLDIFLKDKRCNKVIIVYNNIDKSLLDKYLILYNDRRIITTLGGLERQDSVLNGLSLVTSEYVLVHDGARANINLNLIDNVLSGLCDCDAVSLGVKVSDTIKKVTNVVETIDRSYLYYMQTPQGAKTSLLISALIKAKEENLIVTDDLMAIELYGNVKTKIVPGDKNNFKVTTLEDIKLLKYYLE